MGRFRREPASYACCHALPQPLDALARGADMSRALAAGANALIAWPRLQLAILLALGALLALRAPLLTVDVSPAGLATRAMAGTETPAAPVAFTLAPRLDVTVRTPRDFTDPATRALLDTLSRELAALPGVAGVDSVLDAPLVTLVPGPLARLESNRRTLRDKDIDLYAARRELLASPLFAGVLSADQGRVNLLRVRLAPDLDAGAEAETLGGVRAVLAAHRGEAALGLAGAPALVAEARDALSADLRRLPGAVLAVMLLLVGLGTRRPPVLEFLCGAHALVTCAGAWQLAAGALGVAAAAALPLVVVVSVALAFTLRVSYKLHVAAGGDRRAVLTATVDHAVAASLPASGVLALLGLTLCLSPLAALAELGRMLLLGCACAWLAAFGVGAALLATVPRRPQEIAPFPLAVPARWLSVLLALTLALATVGGLPRFIREAAPADYLPRDGLGHAALAEQARHFGGGLWFELSVRLPAPATPEPAGPGGLTPTDGAEAWFSAERLAKLRALDAHLRRLPGVGRVDSLAPLLEVGRQVNDGIELAPFDLNLLYKRLPGAVRRALLDPFVQPSRDALRFEVHVGELPPDMPRAALLARLRHDLEQRFGLAADAYRLDGPFVGYARGADHLPPTLVVLGALGALSSLALVILGGRTPQAASRMLIPTLIAGLGVMGLAGWRGLRVDLLTVCASGVAFALFVQIRNAGRQLLAPPAAESLRSGTAPPPVRDPYGSTVIAIGTVSVAAGLLVLTTASFPPTARWGGLGAATLVLAMLASQRVAGRTRRDA